MQFLLIILFITSRSMRGRNSSPFSTCQSTLGASCLLWLHPYWEVRAHSRNVQHMLYTRWGRLCEWHHGVDANNVGFVPAGDVQCFGSDCYALAFGVPAALMVVSLCECASTSNIIQSHVIHAVVKLWIVAV